NWGEYDSASDLPNVSGSSTQDSNLNDGDTAWVGGVLKVCTDAAEGGATWKNVVHDGATTDLSITGDLSATGGFRAFVGPFTAPGAAGVLAADQTNLDCRYSHAVSAAATSFVATRAGSIMGLSAQLTAAVTGAGESVTVAVTKNGTEVACTVSLTADGGETSAQTTVAKDTLTFAAGDVIGVSYT